MKPKGEDPWRHEALVGKTVMGNRVTIEIERISLMPNVPAVYAMFGGQGQALYVAYVGVADRLRQRVEQHLEKRDSSVTTGASAVGLNADRVMKVPSLILSTVRPLFPTQASN